MLPSRALRRRAIFLPGVVVLGVWALNVLALRSHVGPSEPAVWMSIFVMASLVLAWSLWWKAKESGLSPWRTVMTTTAATLAWFMLSGLLPDVAREPSIAIGDRGPRKGGGFTMNISNEFHRPQLEALYARAQQFGPGGELNDFTCGDSVPDFLFEMTLRPAGEYNERLVSVGYTPQLDMPGAQRCLSFGLSYLFDVAMREIDHGPPVDYGYVNPSTGTKLGPYVPGPPRKPICRCDLRHGGREWVAWSQRGAEELR